MALADADLTWPADHAERRPIGELIAYARNARTHSPAQVSQLKASMVEWGWTMPVLVDEQGILIAGHGRLLAAAELGYATVPTMVARGWSKAQIAAYRLADNKLALNAEWDPELLRIEFGDLKDLGFDLDLTGFNVDEVSKFFEVPEPPTDFAEYDEDIDTEHVCPKCGYAWSGGKSRPVAEDGDAGDGA